MYTISKGESSTTITLSKKVGEAISWEREKTILQGEGNSFRITGSVGVKLQSNIASLTLMAKGYLARSSYSALGNSYSVAFSASKYSQAIDYYITTTTETFKIIYVLFEPEITEHKFLWWVDYYIPTYTTVPTNVVSAEMPVTTSYSIKERVR